MSLKRNNRYEDNPPENVKRLKTNPLPVTPPDRTFNDKTKKGDSKHLGEILKKYLIVSPQKKIQPSTSMRKKTRLEKKLTKVSVVVL